MIVLTLVNGRRIAINENYIIDIIELSDQCVICYNKSDKARVNNTLNCILEKVNNASGNQKYLT